jgi:ElaB/YqjD/DUF883 family membrane-anchored ribosome-binding protein
MENYFPTPTNAHHGQLARERVIDDIRALIADGEVLLLVTADDLSRTALHARQGLVDTLRRAKAFILEVQDHPLESARVVIAKTESTVKKYPLVSLAAAFGTGICLGALLARNSRS